MGKMNLMDGAIAAVAPERALRRAAARKAYASSTPAMGNYGASTTKKSMRGWLFAGGSAKEDIEDNLKTLRERSRDAYMVCANRNRRTENDAHECCCNAA